MHEIAPHWRLRHQRLRPLSGSMRVLDDGRVQLKLSGSSTWVEARHNGHHHDENPLEGRIIYQAESFEREELAIPISIHGEIDIPASSG
ncbi:hypothetical protein A2376_01195 [Candidatus Woesebacteria bacterium RIFOXYB1_FULL_47_31]|uniref:Uncharacterized protein n=1 Tax=Candidatus Woesebacteria bacterium RIFOXYB1_FULL_47_31 TaxID=1802542 RepID=A0A1F8D037_9BACT|nr:MAG: hypothetical protein A2376_01195 [Candidatus Woesebacteria bacterium RIFOXYB1_FULL_47_31]